MREIEQEALDFIRGCLGKYKKSKVAVLSSFGKDSMVLLDLVRRIDRELPVIWIRTPFLPEETVELAGEVTDRWNLDLMVAESEKVHDEEFMNNIVREPNLPKTHPESCCELFKVKPAMDAVQKMGLNAWFSGLRGTESDERGHFSKEFVQGDFAKLHPLLDWTEEDIWNYTEEHDLPVHPWYLNDDYRSIGCEPCSSPSREGESERDSRWRGTRMCGGGCGLHKIPPR